jgi:hypothetical protein
VSCINSIRESPDNDSVKQGACGVLKVDIPGDSGADDELSLESTDNGIEQFIKDFAFVFFVCKCSTSAMHCTIKSDPCCASLLAREKLRNPWGRLSST